MSDSAAEVGGPDLTAGVPEDSVPEGGSIIGRVGDDAVLLARSDGELFAVGASCTHYHAPLADGLIVGDTVRCPWHHACFSLRTGEALRAPALDPIPRWSTERRDGTIFVGKAIPEATSRRLPSAASIPANIVIVGGGAAACAAADALRREGYDGGIVMLSEEDTGPVDRPNLSKDYLAGTAPESWLPLRDDAWWASRRIELRVNAPVALIDLQAREVELGIGQRVAYDRLLLATGAEPVHLPLPGMDLPYVFTLRTRADAAAIAVRAATAKRVVVLGASFIGLEVAASLRARGLEVVVAAPDKRPLERVLGPQFGDFIRALHEEHGVVFHLGDAAAAIDGYRVTLASGAVLDADFVVAGVGVRPRIVLAERAGLRIDRGVAVNEYLETSAPGVYAAGDIARWPDAYGGGSIRVEHWVVAQRQGQTAARNMLGARERFRAVPFFWSQHYDVVVNYVGHAESWDSVEIDGSIAARDCVVRYRRDGRTLAIASIFRDVDSLRAELEMESSLN